MSEKLLVPDIGDFEKVEVIELLVKKGDQIKVNDPVVTIESDKSSVEIPSTISGLIDSVSVKVGDKVSKGDLLLSIVSSDSKQVTEKIIPKDTEKLIIEAEEALKKNNIKEEPSKTIIKEKPQVIKVVNQNDIDPVETNEWLESLSAVINRDGNERAHYLIKELMNKAVSDVIGCKIAMTQDFIGLDEISADDDIKANVTPPKEITKEYKERLKKHEKWLMSFGSLLQTNKVQPSLLKTLELSVEEENRRRSSKPV